MSVECFGFCIWEKWAKFIFLKQLINSACKHFTVLYKTVRSCDIISNFNEYRILLSHSEQNGWTKLFVLALCIFILAILENMAGSEDIVSERCFLMRNFKEIYT